MKRKKKGSGKEEGTPSIGPDGFAALPRQKTLFDSIADSEILLFLKELILSLVERVEGIQEILMEVISQYRGGAKAEEKTLYTVKEFAAIVDLKVTTVQEHLRLGRIEGERAASGRGKIGEWRIRREELVRYQNEGLLPPENPYRHIR